MARLAVTVSLSLDNATCIYRRQSLPCLLFAKTTLIHRLTDRHLASKKMMPRTLFRAKRIHALAI